VLLASITGSITSFVGNHGVEAVFILMAIDAVFPAASELVMVYAGAVASGAFASQHVVLFGNTIESHGWAYVTMAMAGTLGYLVGSIAGWGIGRYGGRPPRPVPPPRPGAARACGALVRPPRPLGGPARPGHAGGALVRIYPGGRLRDALLAVPALDDPGRGGLGLRVRRDRLRVRKQLRALPPLLRHRTRCRSRARRAVRGIPAVLKTSL
jgi:hypothetical protein